MRDCLDQVGLWLQWGFSWLSLEVGWKVHLVQGQHGYGLRLDLCEGGESWLAA